MTDYSVRVQSFFDGENKCVGWLVFDEASNDCVGACSIQADGLFLASFEQVELGKTETLKAAIELVAIRAFRPLS